MDSQRTNRDNTRVNFFIGDKAVINTKLQVKLVAFNLGVLGAYLGSILFFLHYKIESSGLTFSDPQILKIELFLPIIFITVGFGVLSAVVNLYQSFKASAPIYRLTKYFRDVATSQEVLPLSFRKNDYYQELPPLVIEAFTRVRQKDELERAEMTSKSSEKKRAS